MSRWLRSHIILDLILGALSTGVLLWFVTFVMAMGAAGTRFGVVPMTHECVGISVPRESWVGVKLYELFGMETYRDHCVGRDMWSGE